MQLECPMNSVIEFTPHQYGWLQRVYEFSAVGGDHTVTTTA